MIWGVDFGTSTSLISNTVGRTVRTAQLGSVNKWIPSLIGFSTKRFVYGEDTTGLSESQVIRAIKRRITEGNEKTLELQVDGERISLSIDEMVTGLLRRLRLEGERTLFGEDIKVRFGCPAMWDGVQRDRILNLAEGAGFNLSDDPLVDEPVAACISWVQDQRAAGTELDGTILVFDMGGGTLDVAVIAVDTVTGFEPRYFVKSSAGVPIAGEKFDEAVVEFFCAQIALSLSVPLSEVRKQSRWLFSPARDIKEALSSRESVTQIFNHPNFGPVTLSLTEPQLRDLTSGLMDDAWKAVGEALRNALLTHFSEGGWATGVHYSELYTRSEASLFANIDHVVLAGGMAPMKAITDRFLEQGVPQHKIHMAGGAFGSPNEAISRGLAEDLSAQRLNLARPAFDLEIEWHNEYTGASGNITIYKAYSPLYESESKGMIPSFRWQPYPGQIPAAASGILKVVDKRSGEQINFLDINSQETSLELSFLGESLRHLTLAPNGNLQMIGRGSALHQVRVHSWPLPRRNGAGKVMIVRRDTYKPYEPMWWEK